MDFLLCTENNEIHDKSGKETAVDLKSNEAYGIHGEPRDTPTDSDNVFGECIVNSSRQQSARRTEIQMDR